MFKGNVPSSIYPWRRRFRKGLDFFFRIWSRASLLIKGVDLNERVGVTTREGTFSNNSLVRQTWPWLGRLVNLMTFGVAWFGLLKKLSLLIGQVGQVVVRWAFRRLVNIFGEIFVSLQIRRQYGFLGQGALRIKLQRGCACHKVWWHLRLEDFQTHWSIFRSRVFEPPLWVPVLELSFLFWLLFLGAV